MAGTRQNSALAVDGLSALVSAGAGVEVHNEHSVEQVLPLPDDRVELRIRSALDCARFRRGAWCWLPAATAWASWVPDFAHAIARHRWAHSADEMDYTRLRGLRVASSAAAPRPWTAPRPRSKPAPRASIC